MPVAGARSGWVLRYSRCFAAESVTGTGAGPIP